MFEKLIKGKKEQNMRYESIQFRDKLGWEVVLRNAEVSDAGPLIDYLRITAAETPYLIREPEEIVAKKSGYEQAEFEIFGWDLCECWLDGEKTINFHAC